MGYLVADQNERIHNLPHLNVVSIIIKCKIYFILIYLNGPLTLLDLLVRGTGPTVLRLRSDGVSVQ